jgi:uncharacterized protein YodC (DUF2158 family)
MANKFKIGEVVELKSGGDEMTVEKTSQDYVTCVWRTQAGSVKRDKFPPACLQKPLLPRVMINTGILNE